MIAGKDYGAGDWSSAELALLRRMWAEGATAGTIVAALAKIGPGRSRSAVIAKSRRLELARRESPIKGVATKPAVPRAAPKPKPAPVEARPKPAPVAPVIASASPPLVAAPPGAGTGAGVVPPIAAPAPPISRRAQAAMMAPRAPHRTCQWPMNDGAPWRFCGCPRWDGTRLPYCEEHAMKARAKPREEEAAA